jgi:nitroimidazol reductase NimA-like FMN-containing flavoprotein (pyridoxamine 5'-phosphate oxidase superfamily)
MVDTAPSPRVKVRRHADRGSYDPELVMAILDAAPICHLGVIHDGEPLVLPTGFGRIGRTLYLHGAAANAALTLAGGAPVCVTVTLLDGIVLARTAFNHSLNYRSVVVRGRARAVVEDAEKRAALQAITDHIVPGRWAEVGDATAKDVRITRVIALDLIEASAKVRSGPPIEDGVDTPSAQWSGVLPLRVVADEPQTAPYTGGGVAVPTSVSSLRKRYA